MSFLADVISQAHTILSTADRYFAAVLFYPSEAPALCQRMSIAARGLIRTLKHRKRDDAEVEDCYIALRNYAAHLERTPSNHDALKGLQSALEELVAIQANRAAGSPRGKQEPEAADIQAPVPPSGTATPEEEKLPTKPEAPAIDFDAVAKSLRDDDHRLPSKLVSFMKHQSSATFQDVMDAVHEADRSYATIRGLVNRTNHLLHDLKSRLHFTTRAYRVFRHIDTE
jgi:hypothetical protein